MLLCFLAGNTIVLSIVVQYRVVSTSAADLPPDLPTGLHSSPGVGQHNKIRGVSVNGAGVVTLPSNYSRSEYSTQYFR